MASAKKDNEPKKAVLDMKAFLPQGMDEAELIKIGGLRPIAAAEVTYNEGAPVAGWIVAMLDMPPRLAIDPAKRKQGIKEPWEAIVVELTAPTKAIVGEETVEIPAGKEVIIPVNANLKNNRELGLACFDPKNVFWGFFQIDPDAPQLELGEGRTAMWNYDVRLHPKPKERTGAYALNLVRRPALNGPAPTGQVVDESGKPVGNMFAGGGASA